MFIEIKDIHKTFKKDYPFFDLILHPFRKPKYVTALKDVSMNIQKGECFGLLGPNGAGKTTLLKMTGTLLIPDKGKIQINGLDVVKKEGKVKRLIGFVHSEERSFFWRLTAMQNLEFFAVLHGLKRPKERIKEVLGLVDLLDKADIRFDSFSSGMKRRLSIARALLPNPSVLFIDELTSRIDPNHAKILKDFIKNKLVKEMGKTVIFSTHNLHEAEEICDRLAVMNRGIVVAEGNVQEICEKANTDSLENAFVRLTSDV